MSCKIETSIPGKEDTLQYVSLFPSKRTANETVKYTWITGF